MIRVIFSTTIGIIFNLLMVSSAEVSIKLVGVMIFMAYFGILLDNGGVERKVDILRAEIKDGKSSHGV